MDSIVSRNLYEYGEIMKKQLVVSLISSIVGIFAAVLAILAESIELLALIGLALIVVVILLIVFFFQMLGRLNSAKNASQDPLLINAYNFQIGRMILVIVGVFLTGASSLVVEIIGSVLLLLVIKGIVDFVHKFSAELSNNDRYDFLAQGYTMFSISIYVQIVFSIIVFFLPGDLVLLIILSLVTLVISIVGIVGQFKIANGLMGVFQLAQYGSGGYSQSQGYGGQNVYGQSYASRSTQQAPPSYPSYQSSGTYKQPQNNQQESHGQDSTTSWNSNQTFQASSSSEDMDECPICGAKVPKGAKFCGTCGGPMY